MSLLPVNEAQSRLLSRVQPVKETEVLRLSLANGRVLAADVHARLTQPPFDASAMDGYALRADDAREAGAGLRVIGEAAAGHAFSGTVGKGEAVRIFTGAPVPAGADTVGIQEDVDVIAAGQIRLRESVPAGLNIRPAGQDFRIGERVLRSETCIGFSHLTLAAAANHPELEVYRRPLVAILATGDELVQAGEELLPASIIASSGYGVSAIAREAGADILDLGIVRDDKAAIEAAIRTAEQAGADILVTLGGASVGDHDLVQESLRSCGMELDFWRIAMRPGKPLMVGNIGPMQVLGLPGNPVATVVCSLLFLEPLIRKTGRLPAISRSATAIIANDLKANGERRDYMRARLSRNSDGQLVAENFSKQDSSMMRIMSESGCLVVREVFAPALAAGSACEIVLLDPLITR